MQSKKALFIYGCGNVLGLVLYQLSILAIMHTIKREERDSPDFGDTLNFLMTGVPILAVCTLLNFAWLITALVNAVRHRKFLALIAAVAAFTIWAISIVIDRTLN